jgi:hypothetical protein
MVNDYRDTLGRIVREAWVAWAQEQDSPKPSWLVPWDDLDESDKEVDRRIAEAVLRHASHVLVSDAKTIDRLLGQWITREQQFSRGDPADGFAGGELAGLHNAYAVVVREMKEAIPLYAVPVCTAGNVAPPWERWRYTHPDEVEDGLGVYRCPHCHAVSEVP